MAFIYRDMWGKEQIGGVEDDIKKAQKDKDFRRDIGQIQDNFQADLGKGFKQGAALGAGVFAVSGFFAFRFIHRLVKDHRYRYKYEVKLHYLAAIAFWVYVLGYLLDHAAMWIYQFTGALVPWLYRSNVSWPVMLAYAILSITLGVLWTKLYIRKRIDPKIARLDRGEPPLTIREDVKALFSRFTGWIGKQKDDRQAKKAAQEAYAECVYVTRNQLATGATVRVAGPHGTSVNIVIPPGTQDGQRLAIPVNETRYQDIFITVRGL